MSASREKKKRQEQVSVETTPVQETKKGMNKALKRVLTTIVALVLIAAIVFLGMVSSGFFAKHSTAVVANGHKLSPAMTNFYYTAAYSEMQSMLGYMTNPDLPLSEQAYMTEDFETWHDYLLDYAAATAANTYAIYDEAVANGFTLSEESTAAIESELQMMDLYAGMNGFSSGDAYMTALYGTGTSKELYKEYATVNYTAQEYASKIYSDLNYTESEMDAYYAENSGDFDALNFRFFTVNAVSDGTDANGAATYSEEAKAAAEEIAKAMAEASQGNEQAYLDLAVENTPEENRETFDADATTIRSDYAINDCADFYRDWLLEEGRQEGDTTYIANAAHGYAVLYYIGTEDHNYQLPNVRHILISTGEAADEAAKTEAKEKAEAVLAEFEAGARTEETFAELATKNSVDTGSVENGGLYEAIAPGTMVTAFNDWCFDEARQVGDTGIVETEYGYHVMYFSGMSDTTYHYYLIENAMMNEEYTAWQEGVTSDITWSVENDKYVTSR